MPSIWARLREVPASRWATLLWLAGIVLLVGRRTAALLNSSRQLRRDLAPADDRTVGIVERCRRLLEIDGEVTTGVTRLVETPALHGILRPRLLLPAGLAARLSDAELELVVLHELGHVRRRDLLAQTLLHAAAVLHWFNPLAWLALWAARADCEHACDEFVLARLEEDRRQAYGEVLLKVVGLTARPIQRPAVLAMFDRKGQLRLRIERIAEFTSPGWGQAVLGGMVLAGVALISLTRESVAQGPTAARVEASRVSMIELRKVPILDRYQFTPSAGSTVRTWSTWYVASRSAGTLEEVLRSAPDAFLPGLKPARGTSIFPSTSRGGTGAPLSRPRLMLSDRASARPSVIAAMTTGASSDPAGTEFPGPGTVGQGSSGTGILQNTSSARPRLVPAAGTSQVGTWTYRRFSATGSESETVEGDTAPPKPSSADHFAAALGPVADDTVAEAERQLAQSPTDPGNARLWAMLPGLYLNLASEAADRNDDAKAREYRLRAISTYERAEASIGLLSGKNGGDPTGSILNLAKSYFDIGQVEKGAEVMLQGLRNNRIQPALIERVWGFVVTYYQQINQQEKAIEVLNEAAAKFPRNGQFDLQLAQAYLTLNRTEEAIAELREAERKGVPGRETAVLAQSQALGSAQIVPAAAATARTVTVLGQVKKPGNVVIPADQAVDVVDVILLAGGFTDLARGSAVGMTRILPDGTRKTWDSIDVEGMVAGRVSRKDAPAIQPNDIVNVRSRMF